MPSQSTLFKSNRSQAVRIPKDLAFPDDVKKVIVRRVGASRVITPVDSLWDDFFDQAGSPDIPDRAQPANPETRDAL
jgi:antitoxin VapB